MLAVTYDHSALSGPCSCEAIPPLADLAAARGRLPDHRRVQHRAPAWRVVLRVGDVVRGGLWAALAAFGVLSAEPAERRVLWAATAVALATVVAAALSGHAVYSLVYDSFAHMPAVVWLVALLAFVLASKLRLGSDARSGLALVLGLASVPLAIGVVEAFREQPLTAFGNSNYYVSIAAPLALLALGLARTASTSRAQALWRVVAALIAVAVVVQGTLMGYLVVPVAFLAVLAVDPALFSARLTIPRPVRGAAAVLAGVAVAGLLMASVPALSASVLTPARLSSLDPNIAARVDLWRGAQRMAAERPILGYGPGGYKLASAGFAGPDAYRVAPVSEPLDVAPPSPHSLLWTAVTGFGAIGAVALAVLLGVWVSMLPVADER